MGLVDLVSAIYGFHYVASAGTEEILPRANHPTQRRRFPPATAAGVSVSSCIQNRGKRMAVLEFAGKNMDEDILMTSPTPSAAVPARPEPHGVV